MKTEKFNKIQNTKTAPQNITINKRDYSISFGRDRYSPSQFYTCFGNTNA